MTSLGKAIVLVGIAILVIGTICWITLNNWRWFAGGGTIFFGALLSAGALTIETKPTRPANLSTPTPHPTQLHPPSSDDWHPPHTPPPDKEDDHDAFFQQ